MRAGRFLGFQPASDPNTEFKYTAQVMKITSLVSLGAAFILGACASQAIKSGPVPLAHAATLASVLDLEDAPQATAPSGQATVTHLARGENAYIGRLKMNPGAAVPQHRDATEEYIHILEGSGQITIEGKVYAVKAGTTIYMPAHAQVSFQNGNAELVGLQVFAGPGPAAKYNRWKATSEQL